MPESRFKRSEYQYPELDHFKLSRKSNGKKETILMSHYFKDARLTYVQSQGNQHPILKLYSKSEQLSPKPKRTFTSQRSTRKNPRKGLGHDLDQLTKGNHHELNLSPHPSLTVMVQPNKIDYSERSISKLLLLQL